VGPWLDLRGSMVESPRPAGCMQKRRSEIESPPFGSDFESPRAVKAHPEPSTKGSRLKVRFAHAIFQPRKNIGASLVNGAPRFGLASMAGTRLSPTEREVCTAPSEHRLNVAEHRLNVAQDKSAAGPRFLPEWLGCALGQASYSPSEEPQCDKESNLNHERGTCDSGYEEHVTERRNLHRGLSRPVSSHCLKFTWVKKVSVPTLTSAK
jgi:hypothetical protein